MRSSTDQKVVVLPPHRASARVESGGAFADPESVSSGPLAWSRRTFAASLAPAAVLLLALLAPTFVAPARAQGAPFQQTVTVGDPAGVSYVLTVGEATGASEAFVAGEDEPLPPAPPAGFDARLVNAAGGLATELARDVRPLRGAAAYGLRLRGGNGATELTLSWPTLAAGSGELVLDVAGRQADLRRAGSLAVSVPGGAVVTGEVRYSALGVGTEEGSDEAPTRLALDAVWPNPSRGPVAVRYGLPEAGAAALTVYDALGRRVSVVELGPGGAGWHEVTLDASGLPAGPYFVVLLMGEAREVRPLQVVR